MPASVENQQFGTSRRGTITDQALAGIKVLDISGTVATAYCGKLFADYGADVIDVEPPDGGFSTRQLAPHVAGVHDPERSAMHSYLSANKHSVTLDVTQQTGRAMFLSLAADADVVLEGAKPGWLAEIGLDLDVLQTAAPNVVLSSITWFGQTGPYAQYAGTDSVCHALIGMVRGIGPVEGPPVLPSGYQAQITAGLTAYIGTMGQVVARELGNVSGAARLDTSIFEANLCFTDVGAVGGYFSGTTARRMGVNRFPPTYPLGIYPCKDGWLGVTALTPSQWKSFCKLLDLDIADEPQYQTTLGRLKDAPQMDSVIAERVREKSADELFNKGQQMRVPLALVPTMEQIFTIDQFVERNAFADIHHPDQGAFASPVTPFRLFKTPPRFGGDAPRLGAATQSALALSDDRFDALRAEGVI